MIHYCACTQSEPCFGVREHHIWFKGVRPLGGSNRVRMWHQNPDPSLYLWGLSQLHGPRGQATCIFSVSAVMGTTLETKPQKNAQWGMQCVASVMPTLHSSRSISTVCRPQKGQHSEAGAVPATLNFHGIQSIRETMVTISMAWP